MNLAYNLCSTEQLLRLKKSIESEIANWERRIREQTKDYKDWLQPISEYQRRIRKCRKGISDIDEELGMRADEASYS